MNLICWLVLHVLLHLASAETTDDDASCPTMPCKVIYKPARQYPMFDMNGIELPIRGKFGIILNQNVSSCFINTTELIASIGFGTDPVVATFLFNCFNKKPIHFLPFEGPGYNNVISYLQIYNCSYGFQDVNNFASATDLRVYTALQTQYNSSACSNETEQQCQSLEKLVSYSFENVETNPPNFTQMFDCGEQYLDMAELVFRNMAWTELPSELRTLFPNIQGLELMDNNFEVPPDFPWTDEEMSLPRNLSRSFFFQNHYSQSYNLDIPPNIFRRILTLDRNRITNLTDYKFSGFLHMISLQENKMTEFGNITFTNVTGLQVLDLRRNELTSIPRGAFRGLSSLRHLNLESNNLTFLHSSTFADLTALRYLNLGENMLTSIPIGSFSNLLNLDVLNLADNRLIYLDPDSFPVQSLTLKRVVLASNPLTEIPQFLFWLRGLQNFDLKSTKISFSNFSGYLEKMDTLRLLESVVDSATDSNVDIERKAERLRTIDLSFSEIAYFQMTNFSEGHQKIMTVLLQNFKFILTGNPLMCSCEIVPVNKLIEELVERQLTAKSEYYFSDWKCELPRELAGRTVLSVKPEETYCAIDVPACPPECSCYQRTLVNTTIVDCRFRNLSHLHRHLPEGKLELWYSNNNISIIPKTHFLPNIVTLNLSSNKIMSIAPNVFKHMSSLKKLDLKSNLLAYIPNDIAALHLRNISIQYNSFVCDCHSVWMKKWILRNKQRIEVWDSLTCNTVNSEGQEIVRLQDEEFVCREETDSGRHIAVAIIVSSVLVFLIAVILIAVHVYRLECKVLLYVYLGLHPFDNDIADAGENVDCVIIHSGALTEWVMENIVNVLEGKEYNFVVVDMARDFVLGFSFQENLSRVVRHSKRMILCVSSDWKEDDHSFKLAWNIAQEKIKETKSNYGIIISHDVDVKRIEDKELKKFLKRGRFIDANGHLFMEKLIYSMPQKMHVHRRRVSIGKEVEVPRCFIQSIYEGINDEAEAERLQESKCHAFISYGDPDTVYVTSELQPKLESEGYKLCIPDRDFIPGASKEENILTAINISMRTIFLLSSEHLQDEWSLFVFRTAYEKSLRQKSNHLLVIILGDVNLSLMDKEIKHYLDTYISLNSSDTWFWQKLLNGLPLIAGGANHTSPLFMSQTCFENPTFDLNEIKVEVEMPHSNEDLAQNSAEDERRNSNVEEAEQNGNTSIEKLANS